MKTLKFRCKLLSDIILSEQAATEGTQKTLDYIPGNVFLGLVAGQLYVSLKPNDSLILFHSSKVRFGDAHPIRENVRAIRVPASWHVVKGEKLNKNKVFITPFKSNSPTTQCRSEFIVKSDENHFATINQEKSFAIKSAYDKKKRRSEDKQMYGYQSIEAGMEFCFQVDFINDDSVALIEKVRSSLVGKRTIGRSKTAQYGQVEISGEATYEPGFTESQSIEPGYTYLYAESRLMFLDENGQPNIPTDGELYGVKGANVDLKKSQIRTFRYAAYNSRRQTRDADRFGVEKGSVTCIQKKITPEESTEIKKGVGLYLNEGFGKVLINPEFLKTSDSITKGEAHFAPVPIEKYNKNNQSKTLSEEIEIPETLKNDSVILYLIKSLKEEEEQQVIYTKVGEFVDQFGNLFPKGGDKFGSQWGTIRTKALLSASKQELHDALFKKADNKDEAKHIKEGYLVCGQSASKWEGKRIKSLEGFLTDLKPEIALKTIINLSSEMTKLCQQKGGDQ